MHDFYVSTVTNVAHLCITGFDPSSEATAGLSISYSWIVDKIDTGTTYSGIFAVEVRFQHRDQFWVPQPKLHGAKYLIFL